MYMYINKKLKKVQNIMQICPNSFTCKKAIDFLSKISGISKLS